MADQLLDTARGICCCKPAIAYEAYEAGNDEHPISCLLDSEQNYKFQSNLGQKCADHC